MPKRSNTTLSLCLLMLLLAFSAAPAVAQGDDASDDAAVPQEKAPANSRINDAELTKFAKALEKVQRIGQDYTTRVKSADSDTKAMQLKQEANRKMVSAVKSEGLTVGKFNMIAKAAASDPEIRDRIKQLQQPTN